MFVVRWKNPASYKVFIFQALPGLVRSVVESCPSSAFFLPCWSLFNETSWAKEELIEETSITCKSLFPTHILMNFSFGKCASCPRLSQCPELQTYQLKNGSKHSADFILLFTASNFMEVELCFLCMVEKVYRTVTQTVCPWQKLNIQCISHIHNYSIRQ